MGGMNVLIASLIVGCWNFFGFIYKGSEMKPINPKLHIEMFFNEDHQSQLIYYREDEQGVCNRKADYELQDCSSYDANFQKCTLYQKVTWLWEENDSQCAKDPDMQMGRESWVVVYVSRGELRLEAPLGDETLTYRFSKGIPSHPTAEMPGGL